MHRCVPYNLTSIHRTWCQQWITFITKSLQIIFSLKILLVRKLRHYFSSPINCAIVKKQFNEGIQLKIQLWTPARYKTIITHLLSEGSVGREIWPQVSSPVLQSWTRVWTEERSRCPIPVRRAPLGGTWLYSLLWSPLPYLGKWESK